MTKEGSAISGQREPGTEPVLRRVRALLAGQFTNAGTVPDDRPLPEVLGDRYDSLAALEFISAVEQEFGIEVDFVADDLRYWFSQLGRAAEFVASKLEDLAAIGAQPASGGHAAAPSGEAATRAGHG